MRRVELEIEHHIDHRFVGRHLVKAGANVSTIGSSRDAAIRLLGDKVSPFHAVLEFHDDHWTISDLQSEHGTWIRKKPIVIQDIKHSTVVQIGKHVLKIIPKEINPTLFAADQANDTLKSDKVFHQVVLRKSGYVVETKLLNPQQAYMYSRPGHQKEMPAPKNHEWVSHQFGDVEVQQRLVGSNIIQFSAKEKVQHLMDPSMRKPMLGAFITMAIMLFVILFAPDDDLAEMEEIKKPKVTKYTRILYDAKTTRQQKAKAQVIRSNIKDHIKAESKGKPIVGKNKKTSKKVVKVVNRLKKSGLTKLIGRISKRSVNTANLIKAQGRASSSRNMGRALASVGATTAVNKSGKPDKNFRVGGIATGKGTGARGLKGASGLSLGGIGSSSVGILEEETIIQGGLAKDIIAAVIKSNLGQIRYCYERQLSVAPNLYGKVLVKFVIGGDGSVGTQAIGSSTLNNSMVEGCVLRRISRWKFPAPKGGTQVRVSYPFLFKSTN